MKGMEVHIAHKFYQINGHGHLIPYPEDIPAFMKKKEIFWIDKKRKYMKQKNWRRPIDDASFFLEEKVAWLDKFGIDHEVILTLSQLYCNGMKRKWAKQVIAFQNDFNAQAQAKYPKKITAGFVVQPAYIDDALKEIERCVTKHDLQMLCLPSHYFSKKEKWESVANKETVPIFELANDYGLAIQIHPYDADKLVNLENKHWRFHLIWMLAQTADTYHMYALNNFANRFPNIRVSFAHANQFGQANVGRVMQGFRGRPDLFEKTESPEKSLMHKNIYFDSLAHDNLTFEMLIRRQGSSQVIAGLDNPYPLGEMDTVKGSYPGKVIDDAVRLGIISELEREEMWFDNVVKWLYGEKRNKFLMRIDNS